MKVPTKIPITALSIALLLSTSVLAHDSPTQVPVDIQVQNLNGSQQYIETYVTTPDLDPQSLVKDTFVYEGHTYTYVSTVKEESLFVDEREQEELVVVESSSKDLSEVLSLLAPTIDYSTQDGYDGTLALDHTSITTVAAGYQSQSYTVTETKEYTNLPTNDMSYIQGTILKDGRTLALASVDWQIQATALVGDVLVPSQYKAVATYSTKVSYSAATGYLSTASYVGQVSQSGVDSITYTVTYLGEEVEEEILIPFEESTWTDSVLETLQNPWIVAGIVAALLATGVGIFLLVRNRTEDADYEEMEDEEDTEEEQS